jgi:alpha-tubulin suppressor-like RCC1 family protein
VKTINLPKITAIATGWHHSMALAEDGSVWMWGANPFGQLGDGTTENRLLPQKVSGIENVERIACGSWHTMALTKSHEIWTWGRNEYGMCGAIDTAKKLHPMRVDLPKANDIGAGCFQSIALLENGEIYAWGDNPFGQLGNGRKDRLFSPKKMLINIEGQLDQDEIAQLEQNQVMRKLSISPILVWIGHNKKFIVSVVVNLLLFWMLLRYRRRKREREIV